MKRKNIKKYVLPMIATASLVPLTAVVAACSVTNENVAVRKLTFLNDFSDSERAQLGAAAYRVSGNELIVGQPNRITITFDKYSDITKVTSKQQYFEIYQTTPFKDKPGTLEEGKDYTVENPSKHVFVINFTAEQSKKVIRNMTIRFKAGYKRLKYSITVQGESALSATLDDWWTFNPYACYDFSFFVTQKYAREGFDINDAVINETKIIGVRKDGTTTKIENVRIEKVQSYFKMQGSGSACPADTHYMKVSIPVESIFNIDADEHFTNKFQQIKVEGTKACELRSGVPFYRKLAANCVGCAHTGGGYIYSSLNKEVNLHAQFKANDGKKFVYDAENKILPFTAVRIQPKNSVFKEINVGDSSLTSMSDYYFNTTTETFDYFYNQGDTIPKFENWMTVIVRGGQREGDTLDITINVDKMLKYTQMPYNKVVDKEKLEDFSGGCIDFLDYLFMNVVTVDA